MALSDFKDHSSRQCLIFFFDSCRENKFLKTSEGTLFPSCVSWRQAPGYFIQGRSHHAPSWQGELMGTRLISTVQQGELEFITCSWPAPGALLGALDWSQEDKQPERVYRKRKPPQRPDTQEWCGQETGNHQSPGTSWVPMWGKQHTEMPRSKTSTDKHYVCGLEDRAGCSMCTSNKQPQT